MNILRKVMIGISLVGIMGIMTFIYIYEWYQIPEKIYLENNQEEILSFHAPVNGKVYRVENGENVQDIPAGNMFSNAKEFDLMQDLSLTVRSGESYLAKLRFLGVFPFKEVEIVGVEKKYLFPMGDPVGIYIKMDGVLVIDTGVFNDVNGMEAAPCRNVLEKGDYITSVNGVEVTKKSEFMKLVQESDGCALKITVRRGDKLHSFNVQPEKANDGVYKLGIWIRDSLQGIGTMTAMDEDGNYVALGHGINDCDTGEVVEMAYGRLYKTSILAVKSGKKGQPGELNGVIQYQEENILGDVLANTEQGIQGVITNAETFGAWKEPLPIAYKQDIKEGEAWVYSDLEADGNKYRIQITDVRLDTVDDKKGIIFEVSDEKMLKFSGGIVQGMSGSPIIQDGKIIGAVTHVLVNDPTRGYGIFIENMLEH